MKEDKLFQEITEEVMAKLESLGVTIAEKLVKETVNVIRDNKMIEEFTV